MARRKPKSPDDILMEKAAQRRLERIDAGTWGPNTEQHKLQAFADLTPAREHLTKDDNVRYITAMRAPVFHTLAKCAKPMISIAQADCGWALVEIYARSVGKAGAPERQERVDGGELHRIPINGDTIQNGRRFLHLSASIPHGDPRKALQALCKAIVEHDGPIDWRQVVQAVTAQKRPEVQAYIVRTALEALEEAFRVEVREEWAR